MTIDLAEKAHDTYVMECLDNFIPVVADWVDLPLDHQEAFRKGISAALEVLANEAYDKALHRVHEWSDTGTDWLEVPDWLRSHMKEVK